MDKLKGNYSHCKNHLCFRWNFNEEFLFCNFELNEICIQPLIQSCNNFTVQFSVTDLAKLDKNKFKIGRTVVIPVCC